MSNAPTLVILAAGMGSRYGGLKQLDPMGPNGETVLDYSVFDAVRAGFTDVVFVIRRDIEDAFRSSIGSRYSDSVRIRYAFQDLEDLPGDFQIPPGRTKPWGTGHATRAARHFIEGPFAVINADDFYGEDAYKILFGQLTKSATGGPRMFMVGYRLVNTLSPHGSVNRGICTSSGGALQGVREVINISRDKEGLIHGEETNGDSCQLDENSLVSMNFWGFSGDFFTLLEARFIEFLKSHGSEQDSEFYIPSMVDELLKSNQATCSLLSTTASWFGVTYPEDKSRVQESLLQLVDSGNYPSPLEIS